MNIDANILSQLLNIRKSRSRRGDGTSYTKPSLAKRKERNRKNRLRSRRDRKYNRN